VAGLGLHFKKDYDRAIADLTEAIRQNPTDDRGFKFRGTTYYFMRDYDRAIADLTEAIRIEPDDEETLDLRNRAYYDRQQSR
jgi:tetratricopeptide (TPR) repeat protein